MIGFVQIQKGLSSLDKYGRPGHQKMLSISFHPTLDFPAIESSSRPSQPCTTSARFMPQAGLSPGEMGKSLPSGKHTKNYGKSPFLMGKSTISTGPAIQVRFFYVYQAGCQLYQFHPPRNITIPMRWTIQWLGFFKGKLKPESPIFNGNIYGFHTNQMLFTIFNGY
jgi:hypothetical protein